MNWLVTALLAVMVSCHGGTSSSEYRNVSSTRADAHEIDDEELMEVLTIAASHALDAKAQLAQLRERSQSERAKTLVTKILYLWSEERQTYEANEPRTLEKECLSATAVRDLLGAAGPTMRIDAEVVVSASGHPISVAIGGGTPVTETVRKAIVASLMKGRYVPRRVNDRYETGTARVECRLHVK